MYKHNWTKKLNDFNFHLLYSAYRGWLLSQPLMKPNLQFYKCNFRTVTWPYNIGSQIVEYVIYINVCVLYLGSTDSTPNFVKHFKHSRMFKIIMPITF